MTELEGESPAELITSRGEPAFRKIEERVVAEAARRTPAVISLGGGAFLSPRSRRTLGERGLICWLDAAPAEIARRLREAPDSTERPLLGEDLEGRLQQLSDERRIHYSQADLWTPAQGLTPEDVADRILQAWSGGGDVPAGGARRLERLGSPQPVAGPAAIVDTGSDRYPIWVGAGELMRLPERLRLLGLEGSVYVIADESVMEAHGELLVDALDSGRLPRRLLRRPTRRDLEEPARRRGDLRLAGAVPRRASPTRCSPSAAGWSATSPATSPPPTCAGCRSCRCRPRCWR